MAFNVAERKVFTFEKQGSATLAGQRIREAVAKIKTRPVPTLSKMSKSLPRYACLIFVHRFDDYVRSREQEIQITYTIRTETRF
jgi:hypothetical protein